MSALICGSFAFDTIMVFRDQFKNHILPDKVHILNVSFQVPEMRREFGGCAGNIAYNLKLLGDEPLPMGMVGKDFGPYAEWMDRCGISRRYVKVVDSVYTAQAFITTDMDDNQITAFHPGAMNLSHQARVADASGFTIGCLSPDGREGMLVHAAEFAAAGVPFVFDPGQGLILFNGEELTHLVDQASWVTVNDYEAQLLQERSGQKLEVLARRVRALIVTLAFTPVVASLKVRLPNRARSTIPPVAVTPTARDCYTAFCTDWIGRRPVASPRSWAPSRSNTTARRITASRAMSSRRAFVRTSVAISDSSPAHATDAPKPTRRVDRPKPNELLRCWIDVPSEIVLRVMHLESATGFSIWRDDRERSPSSRRRHVAGLGKLILRGFAVTGAVLPSLITQH
jgi:adenosine kinase